MPDRSFPFPTPGRRLVHVRVEPYDPEGSRARAQAALALGYCLHVVSPEGSPIDGGHGVEVHPLLPSEGDFATDLLALGRLWRLFRRLRPDLVHAAGSRAAQLGLLAAALADVPLRVRHLPERLAVERDDAAAAGATPWDALADLHAELRLVPRQRGASLTAKRSLDVTAAATLLVATAPLFAGTAVAIAAGLGRPIFFTQPRIGRGGRVFRILKFRTMREAVDASGRPLPDDQRLTRLGKTLRSLSLDELPQLFNVLLGDMSLVGPRPLLVEYLDRYSPEQARRHSVLPGITGWAAVNGRNLTSWDERFALDTWYVDHFSLVLDLEILLRTVGTVLARTGVSSEGHVTMQPFFGSTASARTPAIDPSDLPSDTEPRQP